MVLQGPPPYLVDVRVCSLSLHRHETSLNLVRQQQQRILLRRRFPSRVGMSDTGISNSSKPQQLQLQQHHHQSNHHRFQNVHNNSPQHNHSFDSNTEQQQPLPLVELLPFRKSVWRREKSLPNFYEKRQALAAQQQQQQKEGSDKKQSGQKSTTKEKPLQQQSQNQHVDISAQEMVSRLAAVVQGNCEGDQVGCAGDEQLSQSQTNLQLQSAKMKCCTHPKAEFHHESMRLWRTQDFIPGFITRLERTKTSMLSFHRESSNISTADMKYYLGEDLSKNHLNNLNSNNTTGEPFEFHNGGSPMGVKGGKMRPHVQRRPLVYLNPLDSYRQAIDSVKGPVESWTENSFSQGKLGTRNGFPLTMSREREMVLSGAGHHHTTYPLRPVRPQPGIRWYPPSQIDQQQQQHLQVSVDIPHPSPAGTILSPHRFNSKLGAAKNSLELLSHLGAPTKLERNLGAQYELSLERFRREKTFVQPLDLRSVPFQYVSAGVNLTPGELSLREARIANRARRKKHALAPLGGVESNSCSDLTAQGLQTDRESTLLSEAGDSSRLKHPQKSTAFVDQAVHPLGSVLAEESEAHEVITNDGDSSEGAEVKVVVNLKPTTRSAPSKIVSGEESDIGGEEADYLFESINSCVAQLNYEDSKPQSGEANGNESNSHPQSKVLQRNSAPLLDNSRTETSLTLPEDGHQDQSVLPSVGGSSTARATTNLEYLNKLRKRSVPRPLAGPFQAEPIVVTDDTVDTSASHGINGGASSELTVSQDKCVEDSEKQDENSIDNKPISTSSHETRNIPIIPEAPATSQAIETTVNADANHVEPARETGVDLMTSQDEGAAVIRTAAGEVSDDEGISSPKQQQQKETGVAVICQNEISVGVNEPSVVEKVPKQNQQQREARPGVFDTSLQPITPPTTSETTSGYVEMTREASTSPCTISPHKSHLKLQPLMHKDTDVSRDSITPATNLDTSLEPMSETECVNYTNGDNGDSGVSTTFLTTEDSRAEILEGVVF